MNFEEFASKVAVMEGKKHQASIGDTRELLHYILSELSSMPYADVVKLLSLYEKKG